MITKPETAPYSPDPKITSLGAKMGDPVTAADFPETQLRFRNDRWAGSVGLHSLSDAEWIRHFGRFEPLTDNLQSPLALRYHGHQFQSYNPDIGDGRGFLFAQMRDHRGRLMDLGTKGSGQTPYSRQGDGRLTLKGAVRELLATEMLEALGVNTSKTFSIIETGEELWRGDEPSPTRSAVMVRLSHSHIRIGAFQRLAFEKDAEQMAMLTEYCLRELYGEEPGNNPAAQLFAGAVPRIADLAASYMVAGFVHGVLNTDNINITGESFDYGPWRFTPRWDAGFTAAYFDHSGLYAFGRQAQAMHWNLGQLAIALRLLSDADPMIAELERFPKLFQQAFVRRFVWRLGVTPQGDEADRQLTEQAERALASEPLEIDSFFARHYGGVTDGESPDTEDYSRFLATLAKFTSAGNVQTLPACSLHIDEVEDIWSAISDHDDWSKLNTKVNHIRALGDLLHRNDG